MAYTRRRRAPRTTVAPRTARPSLMSRLRGRRYATRTTTTTTTVPIQNTGHHGHHGTHAAPVHHQRRHVTLGDKLSGAMLKLRGSLTRRPGMKAAGTRRMHGTDGRGSRRQAHY